MALVSLGLLAVLPRPAAATLDLWLSSVTYDTTRVAGIVNVKATVEVKKQGTAPVSGAILHMKRNNVLVRTFTFSDPIPQSFQHTLIINAGDSFEASVDPSNLIPEANELNNRLAWTFPATWSLTNLHAPFPDAITITNPSNQSQDLTLTSAGIFVYNKRTGNFPCAFLIIPPFNWWQAVHDAGMKTELQQSTIYHTEDELSAGVTAALAIEAGFSVQGCGATVGTEIEVAVSAAIGHSVTRTYSESFYAYAANTYIPSGDHCVVLTQTRYDVAKYTVTTPGDYFGKAVWIGLPQPSDVDDNPELTAQTLTAYPDLKDPEAVDLDGAHDIGKVSTYSAGGTGTTDGGWHIKNATNLSSSTVAEKNQTIGTYGADWTVSIEDGNSQTTQTSFRCNFYARGEIAGSAVQASFGSSLGRSHKTYQGKKHDFHYVIGGVINAKDSYKVGGWAANFTFDHGTPTRNDGLLILCCTIKDPPDDNTSPVRIIEIGGDWSSGWEVNVGYEPGLHELGEEILDGLAVDINSPIYNGYEFFQNWLNTVDTEIVWATQVAPPPPDLNEFLDRAQLARSEIERILNTQPDNLAWIPHVTALVDNAHTEAFRIFDPHPCHHEPEVPREGGEVEVFYDPERGTLPAGTAVVLRLGYNGWQGGYLDYAMSLDNESGVWESGSLPVPPGTRTVDWVFTDGGAGVDDRAGRGWHAETAGTVRTHANSNITASFTAQGTLGFADGTHAEGAGFRYPAGGPNWLYLGGLWAGNTDFVANRDYEAEPGREWVGRERGPGGIRHERAAAALLTRAVYTDSGAADPRGLVVAQRSVTQPAAPDADFVIVGYEVRNEGEDLFEDLWIGQFADFDLDEASSTANWGGTDEDLQLVYMYKDASMPYVGVCALNPHQTANLTLIHNPTYVYPNQYILDAEKALFLSAADPDHVVRQATAAADWSVLASVGPYNLPAGANLELTFAIVAGDDLDDLRANAARAREWLIPGAGPTGVNDAGAPAVTLAPVLHQNVPNPFNPSTNISFDLPERGRVTLRVFDVTGRAIRTLADGIQDPGRRTVAWDGRNEAGRAAGSGVYLYRLETERGVQNRKMVLVH